MHQIFFLLIPRAPRSTLFPYTTLFRSAHALHEAALDLAAVDRLDQRLADVVENVDLAHAMHAGEAVDLDLDDRRSEEHTSELQSHSDLVCRLLLEKKNSA